MRAWHPGEWRFALPEAVMVRIRAASFAACVCWLALLTACGEGRRGTWEVLLPSIPSEVSLERDGETAVSYILRQTHEPLFARVDGQNFTSKPLRSWSRNIDQTEFRFCPNTELRFGESAGLTPEYFGAYITSTTAKYSDTFKMRREGGCAVISFPGPQNGYLDFLARYDNSPSVIEAGGAIAGLGEFRLAKLSPEEAVLVRKSRVRRGFNRIVFRAYGGPDDPRLQDRDISDFNRIPPHQQPEWIKKEFLAFSNLELTAVSLGINHPEKRVRRLIYNCIDTAEFRAAFAPNRKDFLDIATLLPVGVPGGVAGRPEQACGGQHALGTGKLTLANPKKDNHSSLTAFGLALKNKTGIELAVKNFAPHEMNPMLYETKRLRPYTLIVLAVGAARSESAEFLKLYAGKPLALDFVNRSIKEKFAKIGKTGDTAQRSVMVRELAGELKSEYLALPLYQSVSQRYYPRGIKNLMVGDGFEEYPRVADFRW